MVNPKPLVPYQPEQPDPKIVAELKALTSEERAEVAELHRAGVDRFIQEKRDRAQSAKDAQ